MADENSFWGSVDKSDAFWSSAGLLAGGGIGYLGNKLFRDVLNVGGSTSSTSADQGLSTMDEALQLAKDNAANANVMYNQMGQEEGAAAAGAKNALDSFGPTADALNRRNQSDVAADDMKASVGRQIALSKQLQQNQSANTTQQLSDALGQTGGSPAAMLAMQRQAANQNNKGALQLAMQSSQMSNQANMNAQQMKNQGSSLYNQTMAQKYQQDVNPYLNKAQNMGGMFAGMGVAGMNAGVRSADAYQKQVVGNNPLSALSQGFNAFGAAGLTDAISNAVFNGRVTPSVNDDGNLLDNSDKT